MTRAHIIIVGGVPHLHITRPGAPAETRPMDQRELVRLMREAAQAVLATCKDRLQVGATRAENARVGDQFASAGNVIEDDPPPHYVGALGE